MKEKDQKRLMYELFYGVDGEEDSISYLDMLLKGRFIRGGWERGKEEA